MKHIRILTDYTAGELFEFVEVLRHHASGNNYSYEILQLPISIEPSDELWQAFVEEHSPDLLRVSKNRFENLPVENYLQVIDEEGNYLRPDRKDGLALFINSKLLEKRGIEIPHELNWETFESFLESIKEAELMPFALHNLQDFRGWWAHYLFLFFLAQTNYLFEESTPENFFHDENVQKAIEYLKRLKEKNLLVELSEEKYNSRALEAFIQGDVACIVEGNWSLTEIKEKSPQLYKNIDVRLLEHKTKRVFVGGRFFGFSKNTQNKELLSDLLDSLFAYRQKNFDSLETHFAALLAKNGEDEDQLWASNEQIEDIGNDLDRLLN